MNAVIESVEIGVGSALFGSVVGTVAGYWLSKHQLRQLERERQTSSQRRAALMIARELIRAKSWAGNLPASATSITNPEAELSTPEFQGPAWSVPVWNALLDLSPALRNRAVLKMAQLEMLVSAVGMSRIFAVTKLALESALQRSVWDAEHANDPEFVARYALVRATASSFLGDLGSLVNELGQEGQKYLEVNPPPEAGAAEHKWWVIEDLGDR